MSRVRANRKPPALQLERRPGLALGLQLLPVVLMWLVCRPAHSHLYDPPRHIPWLLPDATQAVIAHEVLPDGRIHLTIAHRPLPGVTPAILAWWYRVLPLGQVEFDSEGAARVIELSPSRFVTRPMLAGMSFGEIRHTFGASPMGALYSVDTIIGVDWPVVGPWANSLLRRSTFSEPMLHEWERHQVEEVGLLPHFLPALYAQRNDRNTYRLAEP